MAKRVKSKTETKVRAGVKMKFNRGFDAINLLLLTLGMLIILLPLWFIVVASISDPLEIASGRVLLIPRGLTFSGYEYAFSNNRIMLGYANTVFYTVIGTLINLVVTLPAGYAIAARHLPGKRLLIIYFLIPMFFSGGLIPSYMLVKELNLLNTRTILLVNSALNITYLIICRSFFMSFSADLEEAARIDGCGVFRIFGQIVLPLSRALIGVMVLYYGVMHWNAYFAALLYVRDPDKVPLQLVLRNLLIADDMSLLTEGLPPEEIYRRQKVGELIKYAVIIISSLPVMIVYPFLQKYFDKGVMLGSLKG